MRGPGTNPGLLFKLVVPATAIFVVTILALIAVVFSDPRAPVAQFLNQHGNLLLLVEFGVIMLLSFLAMFVDRMLWLAENRKNDAGAREHQGIQKQDSSDEI